MKTDEKLFQIALTHIKGIGPRYARVLLNHFGSAENVFELYTNQPIRINGMGYKYIEQINQNKKQALQKAEDTMKFMRSRGATVRCLNDTDYPVRLTQCYDAPTVLYTIGNANVNMDFVISIVGTRKATNYGKRMCRELVEQAKSYNVGIASGLAFGIDVEAHKSCLHNQIPTFAVLAHGLDRVYPASHKSTARQIIDNGLLMTEFPEHTKPDRENFPKRNRIVAGMSDATVVVESADKGGSIITAHLAHDYNRDVFAIPGRIGDIQSSGTNKLIKIERARLIECMEDLAYFMNWVPTKTRKKPAQVQPKMTQQEQLLIQHFVPGDKICLDDLVNKSQMNIGTLLATLTGLEFKEIIEALPGNVYVRL